MRKARGLGAISVVAVLAAAGVAGAADGGKAVKGAGFATTAPSGWSVTPKTAPGQRTFALATPGAKLDGVGVPSAGGQGITVMEQTASAAAKAIKKKTLPSSPVALLKEIVGTPTAASHVRVVVSARAAKLKGARAAVATFSYTYKKREIMQQDVVAVRKGRVYFVEVDAEAAQAKAGSKALAGVLTRWRWR
jgi:hypothetical protein